MPFGKIYDQQLRTFPSELRDSSIQYHELKQIIGRLVDELSDLGLPPETLRQAIATVESGGDKHPEGQTLLYPIGRTPEGNTVPQRVTYSKIYYEVISDSGKSYPQLRVCMTAPLSEAKSEPPSATDNNHSTEYRVDKLVHPISAFHPELEAGSVNRPSSRCDQASTATAVSASPFETEVVIPLAHDAEFFNLLEGNIQDLASQIEKIHSKFLKSLQDLARMIADTCHPASVAGNYHPYSSVSTHPGSVEVKVRRMKSDLYAWREIFELFVASDVFEHSNDGRKVEWSIEESEKRLNVFVDKVTGRKGHCFLKEKFKYKQSAEALQTFIKLNLYILDIRKVFQANIEAIRKLVKKHTEHTTLPISYSFSSNANVVSIGNLHQSSCKPVSALIHPRLFVQEVEEKLFPVVPNPDDYSCAICTNIAFKPIRLSCTHLFCARCLIKMQRKGEGSCPMCRAPSVLEANAKNVDWALLNFMEDWFPREAGEKMKDNEREVLNEQIAEWRRNEVICMVM